MVIKQPLIVFLCLFFLIPFKASANVIINEIAWMGTEVSTSDEWLELYNSGNEEVDLSGWVLFATDGTPSINISQKSVSNPPVISAGGFFLLERTDDTTVPNINADAIYTGALGNGGEKLILNNADGSTVDTVDGLDGWKINGATETIGNNQTKQTAQRSDNAWITATATPKSTNISGGGQEQEMAQEVAAPTTSAFSGSGVLNVQAKAPEDIVVLLGKEITLDASLSSDAASFKWYLGDGSTKEGLIVNHTYTFPGQYLVTLEASNGGQISIDQLFVYVFGGKVVINEVFVPATSTQSSWIEFLNPTDTTIDLGGWVLEINSRSFIFPSYTIIFPNNFLVVSEGVTLLRPVEDSKVRISFPNRVLVDEVIMTELKAGWSAARRNGQFFWTKDLTPGLNNRIVSGETIFHNIIEKLPQIVAEEEILTGKNLIIASTRLVEEQKQEENNQNSFLTASQVTKRADKNSLNNLFVWVIIVAALSFLVSLSYILFLRKKPKSF